MGSDEKIVSGEEALEVAEALNATTMKILRMLSDESLDISTIAERLNLSEAYVSEQVNILEKLQLVRASYQKGRRGIRKVCQTAVNRITIVVTRQKQELPRSRTVRKTRRSSKT